MRTAARLRALTATPLAQNTLALYAVGLAAYLFPLLTAPYLARVLRPEGWGRVALAQGAGQMLVVVVEYGFLLSATREIARLEAPGRAAVLGSVLGAKAVLALVVVVLGGVAGAWVPALADDRALLRGAVFWAVAQGFHPLWYFQGRERVRPLLAMDLGAGAVAIAGVLWTCRVPGDAWKVLAWQGAAAAAVAIGGYALAARETVPRRPSLAAVGARLASGAHLFAYRAAAALYTVANPVVLGFMAPAAVVGYFAGAEKIVKALFLAGINPLNQALYPRASRLVGGSVEAAGLTRRAVAVFAGLGTAAGVLVFAAAPLLVRVLLGPGYDPAVAPLRLLALLLPILSVTTALVTMRVLPAERDRTLLGITIAAGVLNVALATQLAPRYGEVGMAAAVVTTEAAVLVAVWRAVRASR
jgi:PST family polysaccharide transporter